MPWGQWATIAEEKPFRGAGPEGERQVDTVGWKQGEGFATGWEADKDLETIVGVYRNAIQARRLMRIGLQLSAYLTEIILTSRRKIFNLKKKKVNYQVESLLFTDEETFQRKSDVTVACGLGGNGARRCPHRPPRLLSSTSRTPAMPALPLVEGAPTLAYAHFSDIRA